MFRIGKTFQFAASHQLLHLPEGHKCRALHGHTYTVDMILARPGLNPEGFVCDFGELAGVGEWIRETLDHKHLNDVIQRPTCEELAFYIWHHWHSTFENLERVRVSESPTTWGEFSR